MNKVVRHPSVRNRPVVVLSDLLEEPPERLMAVSRNSDGELEITCCDEWNNEDLALAICMMQVWFNELVVGDYGEDE